MRAQIGPLCPPLPPIRATCTTFLDVKNDVLARITEPSKDDYDNDVSDNCDNNYGTFDDFGVKNDQKVPLFDPHYPERARLSFSPEKRPFSYPDFWLLDHLPVKRQSSGQGLE